MRRASVMVLLLLLVLAGVYTNSAVIRSASAAGPDSSPSNFTGGVSSWGQFQGNASHVGLSQSSGPVKPVQAWQSSSGGSLDGVVISNGNVIVSNPQNGYAEQSLTIPNGGSNSGLNGLAESSGSVTYQYSVKPQNYCPGGATVEQSTYPAVSGSFLFYEVDQAQYTNCGFGLNQPQWMPALGSTYTNGSDGYFSAVDSAPGVSTLYGWGLVAATQNDVVYASFGDNYLMMFLASNGSQLWSTNLHGAISTIPTVGGAEVLVGYSNVDNVSAVSIAGRPLWNVSVGAAVNVTSSYSNGVFYVGTTGGSLYAVGTSGAVLWEKNFGSPIASTPAIAGGELFFGTHDGYLHAVNAQNGNEVWRVNLGGPIESSPAISSNGLIFLGTASGKMYGVNASNGATAWQMNLGAPVFSSPALDKGYLFVADTSGVVHAIEDASAVTTTSSTATASGVAYSVPITITNSQPVATPAPFQQMISVDSANYALYEAPNLQNVEFFDPNGVIIPSWLESGNSNAATDTIYWVSLANGIPAGSSVTIYMGFASPGTNLFNTQTTGEAPELSPTYGQYDNGPSIFSFYDSFQGTTLNSSIWNQYGTNGVQGDASSITVNNGLTLSSTPNGIHPDDNWIGSTITPAQYTHPIVLDVLSAASDSFYNGRIMLEDSYPSNMGQGNGFAIQGPSDGNSWSIATCSGGVCNGVNIPDSSGTTVNGQPNTESQVFSLAANPSSLTGYVNYNLVATDSTDVPSFSPSIGVQLENNYGSASMMVTWIRVRAYPPNGIMPTVSGVAAAVTTSTTTSTSASPSAPTVSLYPPQVNGLSVTINGVTEATTPGATITGISWQWGDGQTTTGFFPQTHTYSQPGTYTVVVTATDSNGLTGSASETVSIGSQVQTSKTGTTPQGAGPPQVTLSVISINGLQVLINGSAITAPGAQIVSATWTWGDGIITSAPPGGPYSQGHVYQQPGIYTIVLNVTDSNGRTGSSSLSVTVPPGYVPPYIYESAIGVVAVVILFISFVLIRRRRTRSAKAEVALKLDKLKKMLDTGLITQADYDEQKKKLTG